MITVPTVNNSTAVLVFNTWPSKNCSLVIKLYYIIFRFVFITIKRHI